MKVRRIDLSPDEWLVGASPLSEGERGCYITLCCLIYSAGGPIQDSPIDLAKLCNITVLKWEKRRSQLISRGKIFVTESGRLMNRRCGAELAKAINRTERARESGRNGGKTIAISKNSEIETDENQGDESNDINHIPEADASRKSKLTINHQLPTTNLSDTGVSESRSSDPPPGHDPSSRAPQCQDPNAQFGEWWQHVPRKVSKGQAEKAFRAALKIATFSDLLAGVMRWAAEATQQEPKYVKYPATWLSAKCWLDQPSLLSSLNGVHDEPNGKPSSARDSILAAFSGAGRQQH